MDNESPSAGTNIKHMAAQRIAGNKRTPDPIAAPKSLPGVVKEGVKLAMDDAFGTLGTFGAFYSQFQGNAFLGWPELINMSMVPENRKIVQTLAEEMTRKFIVIKSESDGERVKELTRAVHDFKLADRFYEVIMNDGFFGRGHLYADVLMQDGTPALEDDDELTTRLTLTPEKVGKGQLRGFRSVEPLWVYPQNYNSDKPLSPKFYNPQSWQVMGQEVHASRLATFTLHPVPDVMKPVFAFSGLSMTAICLPYVENWRRTRDSIGDLVNGFSVPVLKTSMSAVMQGGTGEEEAKRIDMFTATRDNRGVWVINGQPMENGGEDFAFVNVPLAGIDKLQAQAQEQMASMPGIPLVKLLGVQPTGLNASSDGEIRVFYDHILAMMNRYFRNGIAWALDLIQLNLWGEIDQDITFDFAPLWEMDDAQRATIGFQKMQTDTGYLAAGVLDTRNIQASLTASRDNPYPDLKENDTDDTEYSDAEEVSAGIGEADKGNAQVSSLLARRAVPK